MAGISFRNLHGLSEIKKSKKKIINKTFCMVNCVNSQNTNSGVLGVFGRNSKLSIEKFTINAKTHDFFEFKIV